MVALTALAALSFSMAVAEVPVWPMPLAAEGGDTELPVVPMRGFFSCKPDSAFLAQAFERYTTLTFPHGIPSSSGTQGAAITGLIFDVEDLAEDHPTIATDESYSLAVPEAGGAAIAKCRTVYGALRALETFSQLVAYDFDTASYTVKAFNINDRPRFQHRGLMIDTGRHFLPLPSIRAIVDSLPYAKVNVLHWHMVDKESFPLESRTSPQLWRGAFTPMERYTQNEVASMVEYARLRGIRVMVEFDVPGHAHSWCAGYPDVCPSPTCLTPLNVASNSTFSMIEGLLDEVTGGRASAPGKPSGLFPDDFVHLGGDEVDTTCWIQTPAIAAWLLAHGMTPNDGYKYFTRRAAQSVIQRGRRPVQWSEVFDNFKAELPKETIVHVWLAETNVTEVAALGYDMLINVQDTWYLDHLEVTWDQLYRADPCAKLPTKELCGHVLGGHGEMWGETVDGSNLEQTVWPRLAAVAEKLWSGAEQTRDAAAASSRLHAFRCLLLERGVAAAPVDNAMARAAPPHKGSCLQEESFRTRSESVTTLYT